MEMQQTYPEGALLFVWNADSGWQQALLGSLHKFLDPETYPCNLCRLTYGATAPRTAWREFLAGWGREARFLHRDEFRLLEPAEPWLSLPLPAVLRRHSGTWYLAVPAHILSGVDTLDELLKLLKSLPEGE